MKALLLLLPPEVAHATALKLLQLFSPVIPCPKPHAQHAVKLMGISFPNRLGLAAGLDKNADYLMGLSKLGFGALEVGTVTPKPQVGNPKPRLFRVPQEEAIINRMGFNNKGVHKLIENVQKARFSGILGINIGKNAQTPLDKALDDYEFCLKKVYPFADYITINISSPNTKGLRTLQEDAYLTHLLANLRETQLHCCDKYAKYVPLVVKISPDMPPAQIPGFAKTVRKHKVAGIIATNTTLSRPKIDHLPQAKEPGGLSGRPLFALSYRTVQQLHKSLEAQIPIIACGGISSVSDAKRMLQAGASLIQIYTGFIYQGTNLIKRLRQL